MSVINVTAATSEEYAGPTSFVVTLAAASTQTITVLYRTIADGSAIEGLDFNEAIGTLTFNPGETEKTIDVSNIASGADESDENFTLELYSPTNATLGGGGQSLRATGVIGDGNDAANDLGVFVSDPKVVETDFGGQTAVFEIRLSEPAASSLTLAYATADGTAVAGEDYTTTSGTVTFDAGQSVQLVSVPITSDFDVEETEFFSLNVTPAGAVQNGVEDASGIATIVADDTDGTGPVVSIDPSTASEYQGPHRFVVTLSESSTQTITVDYRTIADGSAIEGLDFNGSTGTLTFLPGETQKTIDISNIASGADESDENFSVELHSPVNANLAGDGATLKAAGIILDENGAANNLALFVSDPVLAETDTGGTEAVFEIRLSQPSANTVTLNYTTLDGNAIAGEDYTATSGTVTFTPGQTLAAVRVPVLSDTDIEGTEVFSLHVTPTGFIQNGTADSTGVATILADDASAAGPVINVQPAESAEYQGPSVFIVSLSEAANQTITVDYRTVADGSAIEGLDFNGTSGTLTFLPGETQKTVSVSNIASGLDESDENYTLEFHSPSNASLAGDVDSLKVTGVILDQNGGDNDLALFVSDPIIEETNEAQVATFELRLSQPAANDITLNYTTADGTATAGEDYTATTGSVIMEAGQTVLTISIPITGDMDVEAPETFSLIVSPSGFIQNGTEDSAGIATIISEDTTGTGPIISGRVVPAAEYEGPHQFVITLSEAAVQTVNVSYRTIADGSARADEDFAETAGTLTFLPGETQKIVQIRNIVSGANESDENFTLELHSPENAVLAGDTPTLGIQGVILDQNGAANDLGLFVSDPKVVETDDGDQLAVFEITLSRPSDNPIVLSYETIDGTARADEDYTATTGSLTLAAGQTTASVAVPIIGDTDPEMPEVFSLRVTPNGFVQNGVADSVGIATVFDDDTAEDVPIISIEAADAPEYTGGANFIVSLSEAPTQTVTVNYRTVEDGSAVANSDYRPTDGTITFQPGETQKEFTVSNIASGTDESDENFTVELFSPTNAVLSGEVQNLTATGVIYDGNGDANDLGLFVSDPKVLELDDESTVAVFEIRLSEPSAETIFVDYATSDGTATAGSDYETTSGTLTFAPGQTIAAVVVPVAGDYDSESNETFNLTATPNGFVQNGVEDSNGVATIVDNDIDYGLEVSNATLREGPLGRVTMTFNVTLAFAPTLTEVFTYETLPGTASEGADYLPVSGTLDFGPGETAKTVTVTILNDRLTEGTERFGLQVTEDPGTPGENFEIGTGVIQDFNFAAANTINGTAQGDVIDAAGGNDTVNGNNGDDDLFGGSGADVLNGGSGNDKISGGGQNDRVIGGGGSDSLSGASGDDFVFGGSGADDLFGGSGRDKLYGGSSGDDLYGGGSGDSLFGGGGADRMFGGSGSDRMTGGGGNDRGEGGGGGDDIFGGGGSDKLYGGGGGDDIFGGGGKDNLFGGAGRDIINGGRGKDQMTGGASADRFEFSSHRDSGTNAKSRDVIRDFNAGQGDRIDLRDIDAKTGGGNQKFDFIGGRQFSDTKGELRVVDTGKHLVVQADRNGDGRADMTFQLLNVNRLDSDDFLL